MGLNIDENILKAYGYTLKTTALHQIGSGHINRTYLLSVHGEEKYILQNINAKVFNNPFAIAKNIKSIATYLKLNFPSYLFPAPIATLDGNQMFHYQNEYWRLLPFVENTVAFDTLFDPTQAYEAAKQFGKLSRLLNNFDTSILEPSIPGFHDLALRYEQFTLALSISSNELKEKAKNEIQIALQHHFIIDYYRSYEHRQDFPNRAMHHDTKISNVLLKEIDFKGVCVIDLDTLMPGKFISDLGDMIRTYICAFSENETDLSKIQIRLDYFKATIEGYLAEMSNTLTSTEKELILFSGKYIVYMQALRFLTDYLNGDIYYPISYPEQNLDRAKNQFKLLAELYENEKVLQSIIDDCL